jgi:hypothetical protein
VVVVGVVDVAVLGAVVVLEAAPVVVVLPDWPVRRGRSTCQVPPNALMPSPWATRDLWSSANV